MKTTRTFLLAILAALAPALTLAAAAQPEDIEAEAIQLLRRSTDYVSGLKQLRIDTDATIELVYPDGQKLQYGQHIVITVQRPNKVRADRVGEVINQTFYYDGKSLTLALPDEHYYAVEAAPPTIDAMLNFARDELNVIAPGSDLIYQNSFERLSEGLNSAYVVGKSVIRGVVCDHVAFRNAAVDWQIWIEEGAKPFPRKFVVTSKLITGSPQFSVVLSSWEAAPKITDATFTYVPPKDSKKINFIHSNVPAVAKK